jgi:hypothetical protein
VSDPPGGAPTTGAAAAGSDTGSTRTTAEWFRKNLNPLNRAENPKRSASNIAGR